MNTSVYFYTRLQSSFGIPDAALSSFRSHLMDRTQTVFLNGVYSDAFVLRYVSVLCHTMPCHM